jgi:ribosomal protein S18 acetylase RimI-like enzyme
MNSTQISDPIRIRVAQPEDIAFIIDSQIKMAKETENMDLDPPTVAQGVATVFGPSVMGDYYIAETNGERIACLLTLLEWSDWRNGNVVWIHSVYVMPEHRGTGIFPKMFAHLKEKVQNSNLRGLRLYVDKTNLNAQKVYEKLGMTKDHYHLFEWMK